MSEAEVYIKKYLNNSVTENGALGYATTESALLDMNFKVSSYRKRSEEEIINDFVKAYHEDKVLAVKWLFYIRDILEGIGERKLFRSCLKYLAISHTVVADAVFELIPEYGRFDDLLVLLDTPLKERVCEFIGNGLRADLSAMEKHEPVSLLAKWLPSINTSSENSRRYARIIIKSLNINEKEYRKTLSKLRAYSDVVEVKLSSNRWQDVAYEKVPAKANMKYDEAFMKHDANRRREFIINALENDGKLNVNGVMPYEIVHRYNSGGWILKPNKEDILAEALWKKLTQEGFENTWGFDSCIVVADTSGSMMRIASRDSTVTAMEVCYSLGMYFAQKLQGIFRDKIITFSNSPRFIDLSKGKTLRDKLEIMSAYGEIANTDIEKVFDLLLSLATSNAVPAEEIPKQVLIMSDMEFDEAVEHKADEKLFETIERKYESAGYKMPRLIFWNICGRTDTIPKVDNDEGLCLLSGFSQNAMKMATAKDEKGELIKDPYESLVAVLNSERYLPVEEALVRMKVA